MLFPPEQKSVRLDVAATDSAFDRQIRADIDMFTTSANECGGFFLLIPGYWTAQNTGQYKTQKKHNPQDIENTHSSLLRFGRR